MLPGSPARRRGGPSRPPYPGMSQPPPRKGGDPTQRGQLQPRTTPRRRKARRDSESGTRHASQVRMPILLLARSAANKTDLTG